MNIENIALQIVKATEKGAIASAKFIGTGDKDGGDGSAVNAIRSFLNSVEMDGEIVIGEGEKDNAPMLYNGEKVGNGKGLQYDIAIDPVEGTNLLAYGKPNSISVLGISEKGSMWNPKSSFYMNKLVVGKEAKDVIDIRLSITENLNRIAKALNKDISEITVFVLDKPRHKDMISEIRKAGAKITLHTDGDVMGTLLAIMPNTNVDVLMGIGGTPEGVISACAVKALGGGMQGMRAPQLSDEIENLKKENTNINEVLHLDTLVNSNKSLFVATGITNGELLNGVSFKDNSATTESIVISSETGSIRYIKGIHNLTKN